MAETVSLLKYSVYACASDRATLLQVSATKTVNMASPKNIHARLANIVYWRGIESHSLQIKNNLQGLYLKSSHFSHNLAVCNIS